MLFHISEDGTIRRFDTRPSEYADDPVVWAIDAERLRNYLLPRDCPRVTFYAGPQTTDADRERFLSKGAAVVAIEECWLERVRQTSLYCYHLPPATFECIDECAGYYVSRVPVTPILVEPMNDPLGALRQRAQLLVLPNLWTLRESVVASSLQFSIIRMRNALPR